MDLAQVFCRSAARTALQILVIAFTWLSFTGGASGASDVTVKGNLAKGGKFIGTKQKTFTPTKLTATAPLGPIKTNLNLGRQVTITTASKFTGNGDLTVATEIAKSGAKPATLTLKADRDLIINKPLRAAKKTLAIELWAGRKITSAAAITSNGANITVNSPEALMLGAPLSAGTGQILIQTGGVSSAVQQTVTASMVDVTANGALRLSGTVAGDVSASGTISPGAKGVSELKIDGDLTLQSTATTAVNLGGKPATDYGRIKVQGAVTLAGALAVDFVNEFEDEILPPDRFTVLTAGSITGTFEGLPDGSRVMLPDELGSMKVTYSTTSVTLSDWQPVIVDLPWDPGTEDAGTNTYTNARPRGRRHYFRVHTESTDIGAWRTRLTPAAVGGEADLYMARNGLPSKSSQFSSSRPGADGFTLCEQDYAAGQDWFLLVYADRSRPWSVFAGRAYVHDLGLHPWMDLDNSGTYNIGEPALSHGSGPFTMPGESMRIFKATLPSGTPAWSLWLNGSNKSIAVRKSLVPFHHAVTRYDRKQDGQMLVVPPYLGSGVASYFVSVTGQPGDELNLSSLIQEVTDIPFNSSIENLPVQGPPYRVYRVQVPLEQIAWDVSLVPLEGNPNVAVRRFDVPAEHENDGFSEAPSPIRDSITLVPDFLTDGAWYITVYGESGYRYSLRSGPPIITPINFTDTKVNDQPDRTGWRFYALDNIPSQIGSHGWMLDLAGQVPGTEIALRRNAVPSRWRSRVDGKEVPPPNSRVEYSGKQGFLERPAHQPDVWYVGIYTPAQALGEFTLTSKPIVPPTIGFDGSRTVTDLAPGRWAFVRVDVPENAVGWDVRVRNATGAIPDMAVRHDLLPEIFLGRDPANIPTSWPPSRSSEWPTGNQWAGIVDWTGYTKEADGTGAAPGVVAAMGMPLEKGTYYVGVLNTSTDTASSFTIESRGIGQDRYYSVTSLDYQGGTSTITGLTPREARYFKVAIPAGTKSWEVTLNATVGEVELLARYGKIPDFHAASSHSIYKLVPDAIQTEMTKLGHERYVLLPSPGAEFIPEGDYYLAVVSEGVNPVTPTIGTATSSAVLQSLGPLAVTQVGTASPAGIEQPVTLVAGQIKAFQFHVEPNTDSLEVRLVNAVGSPVLTVIGGPSLPAPKIPTPPTVYGLDGGIESTTVAAGLGGALITAANPGEGVWSVLVNAPPTGDATATLRITSQGPLPLPFDGGTFNVTDHQPGTWRYFTVHVPDDAAGWDIRLRDVKNGANPSLMIRRDLVPSLFENRPSTLPPGWQAHTFTEWPTGYQWLAGTDWTGYTPIPARMVAGMGRPLQPGTYFAGVHNSSGAPISYTIDSRGIGNGFTYPVANLDYNGGTASITGLDPREARYFRVSIPAATKSWEVVLTPGLGEAELVARLAAVPDFFAIQDGSIYEQNKGFELEMKKVGTERYVLLPEKGQNFIPPGDYYLAVVSEGANSIEDGIGIDPINAQILSVGPLAIKDLGTATPASTTEEVELAPGQLKAYQVLVPPDTESLEVRLDDRVGYPVLSLAEGSKPPRPALLGTNSQYGWDSGDHGNSHATILTTANPKPGVFTVLVRGGQQGSTFGPSSAKLVITALTTVRLDYDGGSYAINKQQPGSWRYFVVDVPEGVSGWDVRLRDLTGAVPAILVRRDIVPFVTPNTAPANYPSWIPSNSLAWPSENQWLGSVDWTSALDRAGQISGPPGVVAATGHPLNAGTYYIGVFNNQNTPTSYTVHSRGIGMGRYYEISELAFAGGAAQIEALGPREPRYFKVTIPTDTPSWELKLESTQGDLELAVRRDGVPDFAASLGGTLYSGTNAPQMRIRKEGAERYLLLPNNSQDVIPAGDYYIAVVSDGINPTHVAPRVIGAGSSSGVLTSVGPLGITDLGDATVQGISESVTLASSQTKAYRFNVPTGTQSLELRLENAVGFPKMAIVSGSRLPVAPGTVSYGGANGGSGGTVTDSIHTVANPATGLWTVLVRATNTASDFLPDASAKLIIRSKPNIPLNFDVSQNGNGRSHTDTRQAIDDEYNIYEVIPPATLGGQPVLGWILHTEVLQGDVSIAVYKNFSNPTSGVTIPTGTAVIVPPFLTFDQPWYVRVKATGATHYRITSRPITLERPVWTMPEAHNLTFGDSGKDANGNALPGDRGVDLQIGFWHFYAIDVPENNRGLLKTELQAISGNPDLYIREDGVPTIHHKTNGSGGDSLVHRTLTGSTTSYGNWVPLNGRTETRLRPGRWYLGVRAGGNSNVRYRLLASTGLVRELALDPSQATAQLPHQVVEDSLADNDWRYYRFTVPATAPQNWRLNFSQQVGDVVMWVRDTVPPGQKTLNSKEVNHISDVSFDNKNQGPYVGEYDLPDEYQLTTPPLRPGHVYYVGFRSNNSATFSFSSRTGSEMIGLPPALDFYGGSVETIVPANDSVLYRIPVPAEATRFKYTSTHPSTISVRIEQGTLPAVSGNQHFKSAAQNSSTNQALSTTSWPWQPGQTYYVRFVNSSTSPQSITFTLSGKNAQTEDEDNDGMPDAWERQFFPNLAQAASADADSDGSTNATEFADGTDPTDPTSAKYTVTVLAKNGSAAGSPVQVKYARGSTVTLTSTADPGYQFAGWIGGPLRTDDFVLKATGTITIPTAGVWTFGIHAGDGVRLIIDGVTVISDNTNHEPRVTIKQVELNAGPHSLEVVAYERTGGESLELFAAPGSFTTMQPTFRLVGDTAGGGLAVETTVNETVTPGFTVRQVASLNSQVTNLTTADTLLASAAATRVEITGVIDTLNFLDYPVYEGHFADNAFFPLTSGMEDQPLTITVLGNYTLMALHSLPLGVGADAETLTWQTGGHAPWLAESDATAVDGTDLIASGPISDSQSSTLRTTITGPGTLTFRWKVSSQSGDNLSFSMDATSPVTITGTTSWALRTVTVPAGTHTFTWTYTKNATVSEGSDRGFIDQVTFVPQ